MKLSLIVVTLFAVVLQVYCVENNGRPHNEFIQAHKTLTSANSLSTKINDNVFNQNHQNLQARLVENPPRSTVNMLVKEQKKLGNPITPDQARNQILNKKQELLHQEKSADTAATKVDNNRDVTIAMNTKTRTDYSSKKGFTPTEFGMNRRNIFTVVDTVRSDPQYKNSKVTIIQPAGKISNPKDNAKPHAEMQLIADTQRQPSSPDTRNRASTLGSGPPPVVTFLNRPTSPVSTSNSPPKATVRGRGLTLGSIREGSPPPVTFLGGTSAPARAPGSWLQTIPPFKGSGGADSSIQSIGRDRSKSVGSPPSLINKDMIIGTSKAACGKCTNQLIQNNVPHNNQGGLPGAKVKSWVDPKAVPILSRITFNPPNSRRNSIAAIQVTDNSHMSKRVPGVQSSPLTRRNSMSRTEPYSASRRNSMPTISSNSGTVARRVSASGTMTSANTRRNVRHGL